MIIGTTNVWSILQIQISEHLKSKMAATFSKMMATFPPNGDYLSTFVHNVTYYHSIWVMCVTIYMFSSMLELS